MTTDFVTNFGSRNDWINALAIQADGTIVAAGFSSAGWLSDIGSVDFALARYLP